MTPLPATFSDKFQSWPAPVAQTALAIRTHLMQAAQDLDIQNLEESLKWGEPAWRPRKGGTTLRLSWKPGSDEIGLFVDCKTDLNARMMSDYPDAFRYHPPRAMYHSVADEDLPVAALTHLARITFRYSRVIPR